MEAIKVEVTGNIAKVAESPHRITAGTVGLPIEFAFDGQWDGLRKTAVFRVRHDTKIVEDLKTETTVPWELLQKPGAWLSVGVYGVNEDGSVAIPTIWANVRVIKDGADPEGDPSADPTLPVWQKLLDEVDDVQSDVETLQDDTKTLQTDVDTLQTDVGNVQGLETEAKEDLVKAINEVNGIAKGGGVATDTTLSESGVPADAKATGDALRGLDRDVDTLQGDVGALQGDVNGLHGDVGALQGDTKALQGDVKTLQGDVGALNARDVALLDAEGKIPVENLPEFIKEASGFQQLKLEESEEVSPVNVRIYGKTTQDGTPTPDAPVALVSAGKDGNIDVKVTGKNLLNLPPHTNTRFRGIFFEAKDGGVRLSGTSTEAHAQDNLDRHYSIDLPAGRYTIKTEVSGVTDGATVGVMITKNTALHAAAEGKTTATKTFTIEDGYSYGCFVYMNESGKTVDCVIRAMMVPGEEPAEWEEYSSQSLSVPTPNGLPGITVSSGGNHTDENGQQWLAHIAGYVQDGEVGELKTTGYIESYAGETITGAYLSSTGGLDVGASVRYALETPVFAPYDAELQAQWRAFYTHNPTFYNDPTVALSEAAYFEITYLLHSLATEWLVEKFSRIVPGTESTDHPCCYYRMVDGEKEWINPPMKVAEEYRTTERWNGTTPIYTKLVDIGALPSANSSKSAKITDTPVVVLSVYGRVYKSADNTGWSREFPFFHDVTGNLGAYVYTDLDEQNRTMLTVECLEDGYQKYCSSFIVKYAKP